MLRRSFAQIFAALMVLVPAVASAQPVAHPWHQVDPSYDGKNSFRAIIEIPRGSRNKYEVDKPTGLLRLDRVISTKEGYPLDYGFIPKSYAGDHDPLDVLVVSSGEPVESLAIVPVRAIGVMKMHDQGEQDDKVICVNTGDPVYGKLTDISQVPPAKLDEITHFFSTYKAREGKKVEIEKPEGPAEARRIVARSFLDYDKLRASQGLLGKVKGFLGEAASLFRRVFARAETRVANRRVETRGMTGLLDAEIEQAAADPGAARDGR